MADLATLLDTLEAAQVTGIAALREMIGRLASPSPAQTETPISSAAQNPVGTTGDGTTPQPGEGRAGSPAQWPEDLEGFVRSVARSIPPSDFGSYRAIRAMTDALATLPPTATFQARVAPWMQATFGPEISADKVERNDRFIEEALELVQASGYTAERAHALVDYTFNRPQGEINQEVGGVMVTLAAHCLAHGVDMHEAGETELARIWTKVEQIRAKQAAKPKHSAIPVPLPPPEDERVKGLVEAVAQAALWFDDYERQHKSKQTEEGDAKAYTNDVRASYLRNALASYRGGA